MAAKKEPDASVKTETNSPTVEDISFEKRLEPFPHSFHLTDLMHCPKQMRTKILEKIQREQKEEKLDDMEKYENENTSSDRLMTENRDDNFISFLLFLLGDREKAIEINLDVIDRDPTNIVACANRVRFLLKQDKRSAESELEELENLELERLQKGLEGEEVRMRAVADAELAYCYARISPACYAKALKLYRNVNENYTEEYEWKFGEGLTLRRILSHQSYSLQSGIDVVEYAVRCYELLDEVVRKGPKPLNAKAYAALAELAKLLELKWFPFEKEHLAKQVTESTKLLSQKQYFEKAYALGKDDPFVLERYGTYLLKTGSSQEAEKMLTDSVNLQPTARALHHLGKLLLKKANKEKNWETLDRATGYLNQAVEITHGENYNAILDLASAYMDRKYYEEAEQVLKDRIERVETETSPFFKISAMEIMSKICYEKYKYYKILAIEASALDVLYEYRTHFRTVTDLLKQTKVPSGVEIPWQVKEVYRMISEFAPSLPIYEKIQNEEEGEGDWIGIIKEYLAHHEYENARLCVSLLMGTQEADHVPSSLVNRVYLETAQHILSTRESPSKAWSCFRMMFSFCYKTNTKDPDIMILHDKGDQQSTEISKKIHEILVKYANLEITRNDELAFEGSDEICFYNQLMPLIRCIVVVVSSDAPSEHWQQVINLAIATATMKEKMMIVCLKLGETHQVTELNHFKTGKTPPDDADDRAAVDWLLDTFPLLVNANVNF